jgi:type I restriction enzyme S subunit
MKYPKYKPSNVEWIGDIPEHWGVSKYKYHISILSGFPFRSELFDNEVGFPLMRIRDISSGNIETFYKGEYDEKYLIKKGDVVIGMDGEFNIRQWDNSDILLNQRCCKIQDYGKFILKYVYYTLPTDLQIINDLTYYTTVKHLSVNDIENINCILPPIQEQQQIVQFLDEKTELIDKLISTKERKIDLLKQQRTSLINEVITKGLNPKVKLKKSGVEWIDDIPEHWVVGKLKNISDVRISSVDKHIFDNEKQVIVCNYTDVYYNEFISNNLDFRVGSCSEDEYNKFKLEKEDVIITKDSETPDDIGVPSLVIDELENVVCGYHLSIIKTNKTKMIGSFLFRQLQTKRIRNYYEVCSNGITRFGLGKSSVLDTPLIIPPIKEQEKIVEHLDTRTKEIDDLVSMEQKKINLLKEYRQSLISEVITGKIDVRKNLN